LIPAVSVIAVLALVAGAFAGVKLLTGWSQAPAASSGKSVAVQVVHGHKAKIPVMNPWHGKPVSWPASGTGAAVITTAATTPSKASRLRAGPSAGSARAGTVPVWVGPPDITSSSAPRRTATDAYLSSSPVTRVTVGMASHATASALGVHGVVFTVARADSRAGAGRVHVSLDYSAFADAYGGNYAARIHLVELPACALTTPQLARCRKQVQPVSADDTKTGQVGADVTLPGLTASVSARLSASRSPNATPAVLTSSVTPAGVVLAATASASGSGGNYAAEPVSEAYDWVTGGSSGAFTYSYPLKVPPVPGGLEPEVSLDYDSQATDGLTSSTNNEASWIGDGWDYSPGYIEQDYPSCTTSFFGLTTNDLCFGSQMSLSLNGVTTPLVAGSSFHPEADGGQKVTQNGTSWEIIEPDGTQYYFGLNQLPGYAAGDPTTNSLWTVPVYGDPSCSGGTNGFCAEPWRWMLDYVVDPHGNAIAYFYNTQTNYYAEDNGTTGSAAYTQGGTLAKIEYGLRAGSVYGSTPSAQVTFTTSSTTRTDAPTDLTCAQGAPCTLTAPTFWTQYALSSITTQSLQGGTLHNVDSWSLADTYPATGDATTAPSLWLSSVTKTGEDGTTNVTLPPVSFAGTAMPNLVATPATTAAGYSLITRFRLSSITNETGGVTSVGYSPGDVAPCASGDFPMPFSNTAACYPDYWLPTGSSSPVEDWFNLYTASTVTEKDTTGADPPVVTSYTYAGAAWADDSDTVSRSATVTYDQWRGYGTVTTEQGTSPDPVTETVDTYFHGLDGTDVLVSTHGDRVTDLTQYAGLRFEEIVYNGAGSGNEVTDTVNLPYTSTATGTDKSLDQASYIVGSSSVDTYTTLASGGTRESTQAYTYNTYGEVLTDSDIPDTSNAAEDSCTSTTYATNTTTWLLDLPATVEVVDVPCSTFPSQASQLVSDTSYTYDNGGTLSAGNLTKTQVATAVTGGLGLTFTYTTEETATYDEYGRVLTSVDADNRTTTTAYTPATGAEPTSVQVTDPANLVTTTTYDPARDLPLTVTDPAGYQTTDTYDALGRITGVWTPGNPASGPAVDKYTYTVSNTAPSVITVQTEEPSGAYLTSETLNDSLGQVREIQTATAGGGTDVADTTYNSDGWKSVVTNPYYVSGAPSGTLVSAAPGSVPSETGYVYDGDGRITRQVAYALGAETWETDNTYGGNYVTTVPPTGGTSMTTFTDGRGLTTAIYQYHAGVPASPSDPATDYDQTTYAYTGATQLASITDAANNSWTYTYDLLGNQLTAADPDAGKTTNTYDAASQLMTVTDARSKTTSYTYDLDGRKTAEYDTTGGALESPSTEIASWTYDTLAKGQLTSSTSYSGGAAYTEAVTGYNSYEQPSGTQTVIPSAQGALAGTYSQQMTYAPSGQELSYTDSAAGGLPSETVTTGYDSAGEPNALTGTSPYVNSLSYTNLGQPLQYKMGTSAEPAYVTDSYDPQTSAVTEQNTQTGTANTSVDDLHYTYDHVGNVLSEADTPSGNSAATDVQCFQYDYLGRMTQAWAQGSTGCAATPSASAEGGAAPYWESYGYATTGDLTGITSTTPTGAVTTTADTYPAAGAAQPHGISTQKVTTSAGSTTTSYGYDTAGHLTTLTSTAQNEALTWNDEGQLAQVAITPSGGSAKDSSYIYDAGNAVLLTTDPTSKTLYLGDEEITENTGTSAVTGTRYYTLGGAVVAARTGASTLAYLAGDQQDTSSVAIDSGTLAVTRRYYDPYGNTRGTAQPAWPEGEKGFVGGADDTATGLTDLGDREYQPGTGSFISPDPLLTPYDPQDLNAYAYAADNPATNSDPSGAMSITDGGGGGGNVDCSSHPDVAQCPKAKSENKPKGKADPPTGVEISPHVIVSANDPELPQLKADWAWVVARYGKPHNASDEFNDWWHACSVGPYRCHGQFGAAIGTGLIPNFNTETDFNDGLGMIVEGDGDVVAGASGEVAELLERLVRQALGEFNSGSLTFSQKQLSLIARHPNLYSREKGNLIDKYVKEKLNESNDPIAERLYVTRPGEEGPDVTDLDSLPDWVTWYDITTEAQWGPHFSRYYEVFGPNGTGIFWDKIEGQMADEAAAGDE
jgi:RHS repeat-associated protein